MNILLMAGMNKYAGMPRTGLQMCLDPYKDCYGRNILPVGSEDFVTGWAAYDGSVATLTQNQTVEEWGTSEATRIQCTGGTATLKYMGIAALLASGDIRTVHIKVKNVGNYPIRILLNYKASDYVVTNGVLDYIATITGDGGSLFIGFQTTNITDALDVIAYQPQINLGQFYPYALPSGLPLNPLNNYKNLVVQNGSSLGTNSNSVVFAGLSYKMNTSTNSDNYLLVAKGGEYDNQATFTCTFVLNATASGGGGYARLFDKAGSTLQGILAYVDINGKINFARYNGAGNYKTWTTTNAIAWGTTYIVIIKASRNLTDSAVEIFVNGVKQTLTTLVVGVPALADDSTQDLLLGNRISLDRYFLGDFYSVNWTKKLLSDSEVAGLTKYLKTYWLNKGVTI